jgi:hypothetical protein
MENGVYLMSSDEFLDFIEALSEYYGDNDEE